MSDLNQVIKLEPDVTRYYFERGKVYNNLENYHAALSDFSQAIKRYHNHAEYHENRGYAYNKLGDKKAALSDFQKALSRYSDKNSRKKLHKIIKELKGIFGWFT